MKTIRFTRGVPAPEAFPTEQLAVCARDAVEKYNPSILAYQPALGFAPLRELLAQENDATPDQVLVSNGSLQILDFLARWAGARAPVFVERPSYDRAIKTFRRVGATVVGVPLQDDGVDLDKLEQALSQYRPQLFYIIPDFQNPSGVTMGLEKRQQVIELADRYDFLVVEDIPYRKLRYHGEDLPTLRSLAPHRVITLSSYSKLLTPGLRVGYAIGPGEVMAQLARIAEDTYITPSLLGQGVAYEFLSRGWMPEQLARIKALYSQRLATMLAALDEHMAGATFTRPEGGFFVGLTLPEEARVDGLLERAAEAGIILTDGRGFFPDGDGTRFIRLPFCALTEDEIREGVARLSQVVAAQ